MENPPSAGLIASVVPLPSIAMARSLGGDTSAGARHRPLRTLGAGVLRRKGQREAICHV